MRSIRIAYALACVGSIIALCGCGYSDRRQACAGGCEDVCSPMYSEQCVSDYRLGYSLGYSDGVNNRLTDGFNTDAYVAGYWDGIADGRAARPQ